jgi:hypothetical protein
MANITFSLNDYQFNLSRGLCSPPEVLCPFFDVDPVLFNKHAKSGQRRDRLAEALREVHKRTGDQYFRETYPLQARTLDYSARAFPAYRFILPEVMSEDWLAIVDWGKFQRDHVLHQPLSGYIVLMLLDGGSCQPFLLPNGTTLLDACVSQIMQCNGMAYIRDFLIECGMSKDDPILDYGSAIGRSVWRSFFREAAYIGAVFHDLGYPWQYAERMQTNLFGMNVSSITKNQDADQIISEYGHRLLIFALQGYKKRDAASPSRRAAEVIKFANFALSETHGLPGALGFLHLNDAVRKYPIANQSPLHLLCVEWVAVAIMMHDMCNSYWGKSESESKQPEHPSLRLSFDRDPLSAIVTFADVLQEFGRPAAKFSHGDNGHVEIEYETVCKGTEIALSGKTLRINYIMKNADVLALKQKSIIREQHKYFDRQYGFLDMSSLGIDNVQLSASL